MNKINQRGISIFVGSAISIFFISVIIKLFDLNDQALVMTLVAMTSAANAIGIYVKLNKSERRTNC